VPLDVFQLVHGGRTASAVHVAEHGVELLLGPLWGVKLAIAIYLLAGWTGAFLYAGLWLKVNAQHTLAAALFIGNGFFFCRLSFGHFDFMPFLILPLMLWALHRGMEWQREALTARKAGRFVLAVLLMAAALAAAIDGSPVAIIHLLFWIGLYALVLAAAARSAASRIPLDWCDGPLLGISRPTVESAERRGSMEVRGRIGRRLALARLPRSRIAIELDFRDATSDFAALISVASWKVWLSATALMVLLWAVTGIRFRGRLWLARRRPQISMLRQ
jgi:hypothetical protein